MTTRLFEIDLVALERRIDELGRIGEDPETGLFRPIYSAPWLEARELLRRWMDEAGLKTRVDAAGSLFGRLDGAEDGAVTLTGSHFDTVRNGGKYDGALGIHAGISALAAIVRSGRVPRRPIEVVALCEEEGSRFTDPMWGTQAILGMIEPGTPETLFDMDGVSMTEAMAAAGLDAALLPSARRDDIGAFVELHIEQGGVLERDGIPLGIVEAITGQRHISVTVLGRQNHAGTTPMTMRNDALVGAAEMFVEIERIALDEGAAAVATVGSVEVLPGSRNVVPGSVTFTVDMRAPVAVQLDRLGQRVADAAEEIATRRGLTLQRHEIFHHAPVMMNFALRDVIARTAAGNGVISRLMPSGAGHDSQLFAQRVPTAMIFTPSIDGVSHSPLEFTPIEMIGPCVEVLASTVWALASQDS